MKNRPNFIYNPVLVAFALSIVYWCYLIKTARMVIVYDAIDYESLGRIISQQGWVEYFRTGPNREPFYPALIAFSMNIGRILGISYQFVQVIVQLFIVFLSQVLTLRVLRILKVNNVLIALTILYLGFSPAILNSALSLFSEVTAYPIILAGMLLIYKSWLSFTGPIFRVILLAIAAGFLFAVLVLCKGIFEFIIPVFLIFVLATALFSRNRKLIVNAVVYMSIVFGIFYLLVSGYKSANEFFNGRYSVTNRGAWVLYGGTARRMEPLTKERFLTALAYVPGEGVCQSVFGVEKCHFWSFWKADELGSQKVRELSNMTPEAVDNALITLSKQKVMTNPSQYMLLYSVEASKMFFWESTQIGYVVYPTGLTKFFNCALLKNGLRLAMAFLTLIAIIYVCMLLWRKRGDALKPENTLIMPYFCLLFIFSFVGLYSVFTIIVRYLLPLVPLYLIIIAYALQNYFSATCAKKEIL